MNTPERLALYGWPVLAIIILFSLLGGLLLSLNKETAPTGPSINAAAVKYAAKNGKEPMESEDLAEIRALYASDLFASSRGGRFPALQTATNRLHQTNINLSVSPLFLSFPPVSNKAGAQWFVSTEQKLDNRGADSALLLHSPKKSTHRAKNYPALSIELRGGLKQYRIESNAFQDIVLLAEQKPWSVQAEMRFNDEGLVDYVFAESKDCGPSLYHEIVRRLYQCRLGGVTQTCEGIIVISYPTYAAITVHPGDLPKEQNAGSK